MGIVEHIRAVVDWLGTDVVGRALHTLEEVVVDDVNYC